jgi:hypothetical protein
MPSKPKTNYSNKTCSGKDLFRTPRYAVELLLDNIRPNIKYVWECAAGELHITKVLKDRGFDVFSSDIDGTHCNELDFLTCDPPEFPDTYAIITNPPYSLKKAFFLRCISLNVPFALLIPADYSQWNIEAMTKYNCKKLIPSRRINYITPNRSLKSGAQFHSMWLTKDLLFPITAEQTEMFVSLSREQMKNIEVICQ